MTDWRTQAERAYSPHYI